MNRKLYCLCSMNMLIRVTNEYANSGDKQPEYMGKWCQNSWHALEGGSEYTVLWYVSQECSHIHRPWLLFIHDWPKGGGYYGNLQRSVLYQFFRVITIQVTFWFHVNIWQVPRQLKCGNTFQIWTQLKLFKGYILNQKSMMDKSTDIAFLTPSPAEQASLVYDSLLAMRINSVAGGMSAWFIWFRNDPIVCQLNKMTHILWAVLLNSTPYYLLTLFMT